MLVLKQARIAYFHGAIVNIYIVCKLQKRTNNNSDFTLENSLFGAISIQKNVDISKYNYSGYIIGFDVKSSFSFGDSLKSKSVIIFGYDMSFSSHSNNRANKIDVLGKDFIHRAGEMDFKVEGPRNTGKYCRTPWLADKKKF